MSFHVRRKEREITDKEEMKQVLKSTKYVTVALCMDNEPYLVALSHGYDQTQNCLYFHCAPEGKKTHLRTSQPPSLGTGSAGFWRHRRMRLRLHFCSLSGQIQLNHQLHREKARYGNPRTPSRPPSRIQACKN